MVATRRTTSLGRIVYDRKRHFFTDKDLIRIFKARLNEMEELNVQELADWWTSIAILQFDLVTAILVKFYTASIQEILVDMLWKVIRGYFGSAAGYVQDIAKLIVRELWNYFVGDDKD
jgi:hypothetical protein